MPTIEVSLSDLNRLLRKDHTLKELRQPLQNLGIEVEGVTKEGIKLEILHNRPDLLGVEGVARALKGYLGIETGLPNYDLREPQMKLEVDSSIEGRRPVAVMGMIDDAEFDEVSLKALMDLQENLHKILGRDRKKISIGAYDLDGMKPPIRYTTTSPEGEGFVPLEFDEKLSPKEILKKHPKGKKYAHLIEKFDRYPLLVDSEGKVLSMPPIINSHIPRVTVSSKKIGVDVTGTDEKLARQAIRIIMAAVAERGFKNHAFEIEYPDRNFRTPDISCGEWKMNLDRANETLGLELGKSEASEIMERMRYDVIEEDSNNLLLKVPFYRSDLLHEVDLFEDLAIGYGYDELNPRLPSIETAGEVNKVEEISGLAREVLTGLGFIEVMPYMLTNYELNFELMRSDGEAVEIRNPVSEEYEILRTWLLPGLMDVLRGNKHHELPQKVFEVDDVVLLDEDFETGARNVRRASAAVVGEGVDFTYIRSVAESLLRELRIDWELEPVDFPWFLNERAVKFLVDDESWGFAGEVHPDIITTFELEHPVVAFEMDLLEQM